LGTATSAAKTAIELKVVHIALPASRGGTGAPGSIPAAISAGFMLRADTEGKRREQDSKPDGQKNRPARGIEKGMCPASPFAAMFACHPVRVHAPPLLPFGHAALKTGFSMLQPIASKPPRADYRWKIISPL
jgi:hypothetical protein